MRRIEILAALSLAIVGCGELGENDEPIPLDKLPPAISKVAKDKFPNLKFQSAFKETKDGKQIYELRGKDKEGKIRDLEFTADGQYIGED